MTTTYIYSCNMERLIDFLLGWGIILFGVVVYYLLVKAMVDRKVESPPVLGLFIVFSVYGLHILYMVSDWYYGFSFLMGLVFMLLLIMTPLPMAWTGFINYKLRKLSVFHFGTFIAAAVYCVALVFLLGYAIFGSPN